MLSFLQLVWNTLKVFLAFTGCTLLFYYGLLWINAEYQDFHRYDEPEGRAVKVFEAFNENKEGTFINRLQLYYEIGE